MAHRVYFSDLPGVVAGAALEIGGEEANHAVRVKRLRIGEVVGLFDGRGLVARATVTRTDAGKRSVLGLEVAVLEQVAPVSPRLEVWCPPPKGDRLEGMIDQLSQLGVAAWRPLRTARAERDAFRGDRLERAAIEAAKQCGRAWVLEIGEWAEFGDAIQDPRVIVADASGDRAGPAEADGVLVLGPEGGWTPEELALALATGRRTVRFGVHVMRIETAAAAGAACLLAHAEGGKPCDG